MHIPRPIVIVSLLFTLIVFLRFNHNYYTAKIRADKAEAVVDSLIKEIEVKDFLINQIKDTSYGEENYHQINR